MTRIVEVSQSEVRLVVNGPLYSLGAEEFEQKLESMIETSFATVTIDLSAASGIDSDAMGKIVFVRKRLADQNRLLRIRGCSENVYATLKMIQLDRLIEIQKEGSTGGPGGIA